MNRIFIVVLLSIFCVACSNDDTPDDGTTRVYDLSVKEGSLSIGETTALNVSFSFSLSEVFRGENIFLVVQLPRGVRYVPDTAEIQGPGDLDNPIQPIPLLCGVNGGTSYLSFIVDDRDLLITNHGAGSSSAELRLTIEGAFPTNFAIIGARADIHPIPVRCDLTFVPNQQTSVDVEPFNP